MALMVVMTESPQQGEQRMTNNTMFGNTKYTIEAQNYKSAEPTLNRQDFDQDMAIAEQEAYAMGQSDRSNNNPHRATKMPTASLEAAYVAGWYE